MASHARPSEKATIKIVNNVKIILSIQLYMLTNQQLDRTGSI